MLCCMIALFEGLILSWRLSAKLVCIVILFVICSCFRPPHLLAEVFYARDEALALAFPDVDTVEKKTFIISDTQHEAAQQLASFKIESRLFAFYAGVKDGAIIRYAAIDTQLVRTHPETYMVTLSPSGAVEKVIVLAFHEPPEYLPAERWLAQFDGAVLSEGLRPGREIAGIFGSTLSANATSGGVRKVLALFKLLILEAGKAVNARDLKSQGVH